VRERLLVFLSRVYSFVFTRRLDEDFDRELTAHLDLLTDDIARSGVAPREARRLALIRFGGPMQIKEARREARGLPQIDAVLQDLRYAVRSLRKYPAFSIVAIATLAIGIGATTAMFTVVRAVLLRPLPYVNPDQLVEISEVNPLKGWTHTVVAPANLVDWRAHNSVFTDIAGYIGVDGRGASEYQAFLSRADPGDDVQPLKGVKVMGNLFDVLGVKPLVGRTFTYDETFEGNDRVAMLAYGTWQTLFAGDPTIVGRSIVLSGRSVTVVGVMPRDFFFPNRGAQFWLPLGITNDLLVKMRRPHWMNTVARLRPGVSLTQAREQMTAIASQLEKTYPDTNTKMGVRLEPLHEIMAADARTTVLLLFAAVGLLFLIVCANIASLQLGRGVGRAREIAVRRALGAGRMRLVRQLLTEALVLSTVGGAIGVALAAATPGLLLRLAPNALPPFAIPDLDTSVLLFATIVTVLAPLVFGLMPAVSSSRSERLADRSESTTRHTTAVRDVLVACEVGLSVVLIVGAVLLVRSLVHLQHVDPGFAPDRVVTFNVMLPKVRYPEDDDQVRAFTEIERRLRAIPGVEAVGATSTLALRGYSWTGDATVEGRSATDYERELRHKTVTPDYFKAMGIRLLAGRMLEERDGKDSKVTIVNQALARKYFRGSDPIGKRIKFGRPTDDDEWVIIVGMVADEQQDAMDAPAKPQVYETMPQNAQNPMTFVVRSAADADAVVARARQEVRGVDKDLAITDVAPLANVVRDSMTDERFRTTLLSAFAGVALFLAALGVYGVLEYSVSQRSRELGVRLALGARPQALFRMVVRQGMRPVVVGGVAGLLVATAASRLIATMLFGVEPGDPSTYAAAAAVLTAIALVACTMPAMRATRVDPLVALRDE
jgi:putative ABC transport system permease protein